MKVHIDLDGYFPVRAHPTDAGLDIKSPKAVTIPPLGRRTIRTKVHVQLPPNTAGLLVSKSGLNVNHGITSTGLIDEGYEGEICVTLYNHRLWPYRVRVGDKISQLVVIPVLYEPVSFTDKFERCSSRGSNGFGSTGR